MRSSISCMASGTVPEDGACWETVLRFLQIPSPADYSFEFTIDPTRLVEDGQSFEENLLVDEYLFKQPHHNYVIPKPAIYNKPQQTVEWKAPAVPEPKPEAPKLIKSERKAKQTEETITANPAKSFLKLTEVEMVQSLRRWKERSSDETVENLVNIKEADVYALHPADLISDAGTHYFYSATKYSCLKRPTRLRITENGCRWKQQGRIFPIRDNGQAVAYKTYLSYVALKNGGSHGRRQNPDQSGLHCRELSSKRRDRKWSLWTMEEIGLSEDIQSERVMLRRGGRPHPFPVICRIVCKRDATTSNALPTRIRNRKSKRAPQMVPEPKPIALNPYAIVHTDDMMKIDSSSHAISDVCMGAGDILDHEDEIIRALIYDLPYGKVNVTRAVM